MSNPAFPEQFIAAQKTAYDNLSALLGTSLDSFEKLSALHLASSRNALLGHFESAKSLLGTKDPQQYFALQVSLAQPQIEKLIAYSRSLYDLSAETQEEFAKLFESAHAELNTSISSALDWYAKSSANSEVAVAAVKSAISAANSAIENVNKAARQVADITEAGVTAATSATVRAVGSAAPRGKKAA